MSRRRSNPLRVARTAAGGLPFQVRAGVWLAFATACCAVVVTTVWAAPAGSRPGNRRLFEAFTRKPGDTPPQRFIAAPTPPPLIPSNAPTPRTAMSGTAAGGIAVGSGVTLTSPPPAAWPGTWDELTGYADALGKAALRIGMAAIDPNASAAMPVRVTTAVPSASGTIAPKPAALPFNPAGSAAPPP